LRRSPGSAPSSSPKPKTQAKQPPNALRPQTAPPQEIHRRGRGSLDAGDLTLAEMIGAGGFGEVYRAAYHRRPAAAKARAAARALRPCNAGARALRLARRCSRAPEPLKLKTPVSSPYLRPQASNHKPKPQIPTPQTLNPQPLNPRCCARARARAIRPRCLTRWR
jgi:hypothetical protein